MTSCTYHVHTLTLYGTLLCPEQLSSIPGLEEVTIDGMNQQQTTEANGPTTASQSQTGGPPRETLPPPEVDVQTCTQMNRYSVFQPY